MAQGRNGFDAGMFDVGYGLASVKVTTGNVAITTTECSYHGIAIRAGSTALADVVIYDSTAAAGNIVEILNVTQGKSVWIDRFIPVQARKGLFIVATGTGMDGAVFYAPKG